MRRARITFSGAFHHCMNRGYEGRPVFRDASDKEHFLALTKKACRIFRIRIIAYCIMSNHFHLVMENTSGKMSLFFKQLNGEYGSYFRRKYKGRGYVFQDRYKSTLIQADSYLMPAVAYVLNNPVRAGLADSFLDYAWSSARFYFSDESNGVADKKFVEELFGSLQNFQVFVTQQTNIELPILHTRVGKVIGGEEWLEEALLKYDRRNRPEHTLESKRIDDLQFVPVEQVYSEFQHMHGIKVEELPTHKMEGKRLRAEFLVHLKERAGLKYTEIVKCPGFEDVKLFSLGWIYKNAKARMEK